MKKALCSCKISAANDKRGPASPFRDRVKTPKDDEAAGGRVLSENRRTAERQD
ncbi:hypothetical protein [Sporisorium scitamineum]|uniref:Uncharacterized protein n=1 Tax=Sporisorium scitamineum TaxID=49012 RepID=A0A0F7S7T3_9BASI|nr:hypothetical protein [Sporisorium scitamineum]